MYVATLTADEITYAGGKVGVTNMDYYLLSAPPLSPLSMSSMSPSYFSSSGFDYVYGVDFNGEFKNIAVSYGLSFRTAVNLIKNIEFEPDGTGTKENVIVD